MKAPWALLGLLGFVLVARGPYAPPTLAPTGLPAQTPPLPTAAPTPLPTPTPVRHDDLLSVFTEQALAIEQQRNELAARAAQIASLRYVGVATKYAEDITPLKAKLIALDSPKETQVIKDTLIEVYSREQSSVRVAYRNNAYCAAPAFGGNSLLCGQEAYAEGFYPEITKDNVEARGGYKGIGSQERITWVGAQRLRAEVYDKWRQILRGRGIDVVKFPILATPLTPTTSGVVGPNPEDLTQNLYNQGGGQQIFSSFIVPTSGEYNPGSPYGKFLQRLAPVYSSIFDQLRGLGDIGSEVGTPNYLNYLQFLQHVTQSQTGSGLGSPTPAYLQGLLDRVSGVFGGGSNAQANAYATELHNNPHAQFVLALQSGLQNISPGFHDTYFPFAQQAFDRFVAEHPNEDFLPFFVQSGHSFFRAGQ